MVLFKKNSFIFILTLFIVPHSWGSAEPWLTKMEHQHMLEVAEQFAGAPYSFGARRPSSQDCSSLIQQIFLSLGIQLPRSSREQVRDQRFQEISVEEKQAGDLVFFKNTYRKGVSHVGILLSDSTLLHASPRDKRVVKSEFSPQHPLWRKMHSIRRWKYHLEVPEVSARYSWDD